MKWNFAMNQSTAGKKKVSVRHHAGSNRHVQKYGHILYLSYLYIKHLRIFVACSNKQTSMKPNTLKYLYTRLLLTMFSLFSKGNRHLYPTEAWEHSEAYGKSIIIKVLFHVSMSLVLSLCFLFSHFVSLDFSLRQESITESPQTFSPFVPGKMFSPLIKTWP